MKMHKPWSKRS